MILTDVITGIKATTDSIPFIQETFMHPLGAEVLDFDNLDANGIPRRTGSRITAYPALIFAPAGFDNEFSTNDSNHQTFRFNAWLIINAENIENTDIYERVLPNAIDGVLTAFNRDWDRGTSNGNRIWSRMASGSFGISAESKGREVFCEMQLVVRADVSLTEAS
jgi:hypothetical protein